MNKKIASDPFKALAISENYYEGVLIMDKKKVFKSEVGINTGKYSKQK